MGREITKRYAKNQICLFFTKEWPEADAEKLEVDKISDGFSNTVHVVRRTNSASAEPEVVVLRHYGGNDIELASWSTKNSETEETLIVQKMSAKGWGARLYGVFPGGRVEEYVDCISLAPEVVAGDMSITHEIARNYARFHSIQLPLPNGKLDIFRDKVSLSDPAKREALEQQIQEKRPELVSDLSQFLDWNTELEKKWLFQVMSKEQFRQGLALVDCNYLNILLRKNRKEGKSFIVLVDYELAAYGYTAIDVGGHLVMRVMEARKDNFLSGFEYPSEDEVHGFVAAYANECRELGTLRDVDTMERFQREAQLGSLLSIIYITESLRGNLDTISAYMGILSCLAKLHALYDDLKAKLLQ